jgi:U32 family peptidase
MKKKPELLAPAGNFEKLNVAFAFGADAAYIGINQFGLRKYSDNFSLAELQDAVELANSKQKKIYLALNSFAHNSDIKQTDHLWAQLNNIKPHALIIADIGVLQFAKRYTDIPIHISTQANVLNQYSCNFWKKAGAKRIILAREVALDDCLTIKKNCDLELEIFIHGAMCAGYSGKCVLSNYTSDRDANRGGCVQNCRHKYDIFSQESQDKLYSANIMNTKDLMTISLLPEILSLGIDSLKIEGRMKSNMYVANTTAIYRKAIDEVFELLHDNSLSTFDSYKFEKELKKVSNRTFCLGYLENNKTMKEVTSVLSNIHYEFSGYEKQVEFLGIVKEVIHKEGIIIESKNPFTPNDQLELFSQNGQTYPFIPNKIMAMNGEELKKTKPNSLVSLPWIKEAKKYDIIRKILS